jgi:tetratricopeptide (TPR) repeat protein
LTGHGTLAKGQTANSEAMALYQNGRFFWNKRRQADHLKAIEYFNQTLKLDPNFALAYAGLGDVYTVDSFRVANQAERDETGRRYALKALEIEPELAARTPRNGSGGAEPCDGTRPAFARNDVRFSLCVYPGSRL